jgi:predicted transcriptional regulator
MFFREVLVWRVSGRIAIMPRTPQSNALTPATMALSAALGSDLRLGIIQTLGRMDRATVQELATAMGVSRASIAHQVNVMEELGFLTATIPSNDGRTGRTVSFALNREALGAAFGELVATVLLPSGVQVVLPLQSE